MFVKYTLVDNATGIPVNIEPARAGTKQPDGVVEMFFLESSFRTGIPVFYGKCDEISKEWEFVEVEELLEVLKTECSYRLKRNFQEVINTDVEVDGIVFNTNSVGSLMEICKYIEITGREVDFLASEWTTLNSENINTVLSALIGHTQKCFSLRRGIESEISESDDVNELLLVLKRINKFSNGVLNAEC